MKGLSFDKTTQLYGVMRQTSIILSPSNISMSSTADEEDSPWNKKEWDNESASVHKLLRNMGRGDYTRKGDYMDGDFLIRCCLQRSMNNNLAISSNQTTLSLTSACMCVSYKGCTCHFWLLGTFAVPSWEYFSRVWVTSEQQWQRSHT